VGSFPAITFAIDISTREFELQVFSKLMGHTALAGVELEWLGVSGEEALPGSVDSGFDVA
jgi:hypothetical protein